MRFEALTSRLHFICALFAAVSLSSGSASAADLARGKTLFGERCSSCHGPMGAGDGPLAASLPAGSKPRNLQSEPMKFATDDTKFKELLQKGGGAVGLNVLMPPAPDLSDADRDSIIAFVRSLHK